MPCSSGGPGIEGHCPNRCPDRREKSACFMSILCGNVHLQTCKHQYAHIEDLRQLHDQHVVQCSVLAIIPAIQRFSVPLIFFPETSVCKVQRQGRFQRMTRSLQRSHRTIRRCRKAQPEILSTATVEGLGLCQPRMLLCLSTSAAVQRRQTSFAVRL